MAELVDASDSKSGFRKKVQVRFLFWAQKKPAAFVAGFFFLHSLKTRCSALTEGALYLQIIQMFFVYAISSLTRNYIYVGLTNDINRRLSQHQNGQNKTTRVYKPFELILTEAFETRIQARKREKSLKSGSGKEFLKALIH